MVLYLFILHVFEYKVIKSSTISVIQVKNDLCVLDVNGQRLQAWLIFEFNFS